MGKDEQSARAVALDLVQAVLRRRRPLDEALAAHPGLAALESRDRAFARLLAATVLRRLGQIDAVLGHCLERPLPRKAMIAHDILRLGAVQLLFLKTAAHAAVDTSVGLVQSRGQGAYKGLVNAVLRRLVREGDALIAAQDASQGGAPRLNTPDWLWRSWCTAYGEATARAIAAAHLAEPPLDLTVKGDLEAWAERLGAWRLPTGSLRRPAHGHMGRDSSGSPSGSMGGGMGERMGGGPVTELPGYADGAWWVQDAAAAIPARLLGDVAGQEVLDLCAAPGGKTAQLAAAGARVTAVDLSENRLDRLTANLARLRLDAHVVCADAARWRPPAPAAFVLLDAPCTATGALRRHPDIARLKGPEDVVRLARLQDRLLAAAWEMLAPGGVLVFCTCSLQPEEGPERVAALLRTGAPLRRDPIAGDEVGGLAELVTAAGDLRTLPCHLGGAAAAEAVESAEDGAAPSPGAGLGRGLDGGLDGFYAARLRRVG